jgi:hypothetical protein
MSDSEKDKLIRVLYAAWETSLHNIDALRLIVQDVPDWERKFALHRHDFERTLYTTRRLAPIRNAIRDILGSDDSHTLLHEAQKLLNRKLN